MIKRVTTGIAPLLRPVEKPAAKEDIVATSKTVTSSFDTTPVPHAAAEPGLTSDVDPSKVTYQNVQKGQLFVDGLSYDDVTQGDVGDCYFLSSVASIASSDPDALKNLIKPAGNGQYDVQFFEKTKSGAKPVTVRVDGEIPMDKNGIVYAGSRDEKELWVGLVEKAFAKWQGGYEVINQGGYPEDALFALTGRTSDYVEDLQTAKPAKVWNLLTEATKDHRPMAAGTWSQDDFKLNYEKVGLVDGHAYSVLGASEKDGQQTVTLRNPWGEQEFGNDGKNDGTFTMTFDDFRKYFGDLTVLKQAVAS
jgi:calpain-15